LEAFKKNPIRPIFIKIAIITTNSIQEDFSFIKISLMVTDFIIIQKLFDSIIVIKNFLNYLFLAISFIAVIIFNCFSITIVEKKALEMIVFKFIIISIIIININPSLQINYFLIAFSKEVN
jgi:hypothetical protein